MGMKTMEACTYLGQFMNKSLIRFILSPQTITRTVSWIFSVIVCASITSGGFQNLPISSKLNCVLNENPAACGYAIGFGIVAGLLCLLFLLLDFFDSYIRTWFFRKSICIADFVCSVLCAALWFIGFCFLAHQWALSVPDTYPLGVGSGQNAIVFSFLSIPCWVVLSYMAFMRFSSSNVDEYKHSAEVAILPIMRSLSSLSSGQIDPLECSKVVTPSLTSAQEMNNTFQN